MTQLDLTYEDYERAAQALGVDVVTIKAVAEVEAAGQAFLRDGRPTILYEAHVFHRQTKGIHSGAKDRHGKSLSSPSWDRSLYGAAGAHQHNRMEDAAAYDWGAAHRSASWGMFQILGENHKSAGHDTIESFVSAMHEHTGRHLEAFVNFILNDKRLVAALRSRDWATFARIYNGPGYAQNQYDTKLAAAYARHSQA